jgi:formate dehydrogenase major subunit
VHHADDPRDDRPIRGGKCPGKRRSTTPRSEFKRIQAQVRQRTRSAASPPSRCTNEEAFVVQKMIRAAFGNNNVDTCARVCHSPTGYGLKHDLRHLRRHAGLRLASTQADVILVIGANPTDGHPVFASRMKRRLREGAKLIVVDPRRIDLVASPHVAGRPSPAAAARHQRRRRSTPSRT